MEKSVGEGEVSFDGDILISILSYLSLIDLVSASQVSKSWNRAVFFSLRHLKTMPWFFLYSQKSFPPYTMSPNSMAYDPGSNKWIELKTESPSENVSVVRSSHSTLLYAISPTKLSFSVDSFHLNWRHVAPPRLWRVDPVVALVGTSLVVAGGVSEFDDDGDRLAVELLVGGEWQRCESMPEFLLGSASSTWLSVAASSEKMYVTEKRSGVSCCFDTETRSWTELLHLCPVDEEGLYFRVIGFAGDRLIMAGITGDEYNPNGIQIWQVVLNDSKFRRIGSMPQTCFEKLRGTASDCPLTSVTLNVVGDMVYIHDDATVAGGEIVAAELEGGKLLKWRTLCNADATWNQTHVGQRRVVASSNVTFSDLKTAFRDNMTFST